MHPDRQQELETRWEDTVNETLKNMVKSFNDMSLDNARQHGELSSKIEAHYGDLSSKIEALSGRIDTLAAKYVAALEESSKKLESKNKIIRGLSYVVVSLVCFIIGAKLTLLGLVKNLGF